MPHKHTANQKIPHSGVLGGCTRKPKKAALTGGIPGVNAYAHHIRGATAGADGAPPATDGVGPFLTRRIKCGASRAIRTIRLTWRSLSQSLSLPMSLPVPFPPYVPKSSLFFVSRPKIRTPLWLKTTDPPRPSPLVSLACLVAPSAGICHLGGRATAHLKPPPLCLCMW